MKTGILLLSILLLNFIPLKSNSQLVERLKNTAKNAIENRIDSKVEQGVQKGADELEKLPKKKKKIKAQKSKKENSASVIIEKPVINEEKTNSYNNIHNFQHNSNDTESTSKTEFQVTRSNTQNKFEFEPGDELIYSEDFSEDKLDEFAISWFTNNNGVVSSPEFLKGKWLHLFPSSRYLSPLLSHPLPENFTIEFDLTLNLSYQGYVYPEIKFGFIENVKGDSDGRKFFNEDRSVGEISTFNFAIQPSQETNSLVILDSYNKGSLYFKKEDISIPQLNKQFGKPIRISIWVQKNRFRLWMDQSKIVDIPQAIPTNANFNRLFFEISSSIQTSNELGIFISNVRIAEAYPDLRAKLNNEGKFSTNAILFDTNSDKIKPFSNTIIEKIAKILQESNNIKIKIVGHTDNEGKETDNLILSQKRALAVKNMLVQVYGIESSRIETSGEGESKPVAENNTANGKKLNRRVEIIKL